MENILKVLCDCLVGLNRVKAEPGHGHMVAYSIKHIERLIKEMLKKEGSIK